MQDRESFDPYVKWLGIRSVRRPPNLYRLLGVELFESDPDVISHAADARIVHLRNFQTGPHRELAQKILEEIQGAKAILLDAEKKAVYDERLRAELAAEGEHGAALPSVIPPPLPVQAPPPQTGAWANPVEEAPTSAKTPLSQPDWAMQPRTFWIAALGVIILLLLAASVVAIIAQRRSTVPEIAEGEVSPPEETMISEEGLSEKGSSAPSSEKEGHRPKEGLPGQAASSRSSRSERGSDSGRAEKGAEAAGSEKTSSSDPTSSPADKSKPEKIEGKENPPEEKGKMSPGEPASANPAEKPGQEKSPPEKSDAVDEKEKPPAAKESPASEKEKAATKPEESSSGKEPPSSQASVPPRLPVPSAEEQKRAEAVVRDLFKKELTEAKLPPEKLALAEKLLKEALATQDDPAAAYVLFGLASGLAAAGGDLRKSLEIIDAASSRFAIHAIGMKMEVLEKALPALRTAPQPGLLAYELSDLALTVLEEAIVADEIDQAAQAYKLASSVVKRSGDNELSQEVFSRNHCLQVFQKQYESFRAAEKQLASSPEDAGAHATVGRWQCFLKGLWEKGLPHLAQAQPPELASLAQADLKSPEDPKSQFLLAERWLKYADSETEEARGHIQLRAAYWYRQALPDLSGFDKLSAEKQLEKLPTVPPLFTRRQRGEVVPGNVALEIAGAKITGTNTTGSYLIDGRLSEAAPASGTSPCTWTITFPKLYSLREIRLLLVERSGIRPRHYGYILAVSTDGKRFTPLVDRSKGQWMGWQVIRFPARPVRAIQLIGFRESGDREFAAVELEAYCVPPKYPPGTPSEPPPGLVSEETSLGPRKKRHPEEKDSQEEPHKKSRPPHPKQE